ncbi:F-box domain-containing protein [Sarocladium implicatum]|nr:F-box domain-containing protein [Sarocladium implicatum]
MADGAAPGEATHEKSAFRFLDLPLEVQHSIITQCSTPDLICIALVSKRFRELAASHLYRNFNIVFPDDDDLNFDSPIDGLAGGLDTFTTSDYNYAQHLKDLSMDTLSAGIKGEQSYQSYLYSSSCGKFLNTLLYLTLKRSKCLQAFRWNIRVELSRPVYEQLHRIKTLKHLHIRMQAGESYYQTPPPLPSSSAVNIHDSSYTHWPGVIPGTSPPMPSVYPLSTSPPVAGTGTSPSSFWHSQKPPSRVKTAKYGVHSKMPATLGGFKGLRTLSVLDIDDTELVDELRQVIRNSGNLKELHLSFSDALAQQSRTPNPLIHDPEDSDIEDDYAIHDHESSLHNSAPAKAFRAAQERKVQEAVLGKILGVEPVLLKKRNLPSISEPGSASLHLEKDKPENERLANNVRDDFAASLNKVSKQLMALQAGSDDLSAAQQDVLDMIAKAAKKYVESEVVSDKNGTPGEAGSSNSKEQGESISNGASGGTATLNSQTPAAEEDVESSSDPATGHKHDLNSSDEIAEEDDIEPVETFHEAKGDEEEDRKGRMIVDLRIPGLSTVPRGTPRSPRTATKALQKDGHIVRLKSECLDLQNEAAAVAQRIQDLRVDDPGRHEEFLEKAEEDLASLNHSIASLKKSIRSAERGRNVTDQESQAVAEYTRQTRGLTLESLSIHLIPVKASVLSRSINLSSLKQLTLLNVGNQAPIWALLKRENETQPLALRSVFTDHVSSQFILCMAALPELHELYMLQRSSKHRPESEAPPCTVKLDHIRRLVLSKHIGTLERLMIKDESNGVDWDVNEKTMVMICTRGVKLKELAVSMNIHAVHAFMQYFSGLKSLRALNILHFRNNDTCVWVMREILRFIVDNLSHHPELKLEWIAMENDRVDRIIRPSVGHRDHDDDSEGEDEVLEKLKKSNEHSLGKAKLIANTQYPIMPSIELDTDSDSDDDHDSGQRLRYKTVGPLQFYDTWGIKIFEKEIRAGKI